MAEVMPQEIVSRLNAVVTELQERFRPNRIILFGSYASGRQGPHSDVDLLVVAPHLPTWSEAYRFRMELHSKFRLRLHLLFMREVEFLETKDVVGGLAFPASQAGIVLYEQKP